MTSTKPSKLDRLLWRKIAYNEAIDASFLAIGNQPLLAVDEDRIVVAHEQHWQFQSFGPGIANDLESGDDRDAIFQSNLRYFLTADNLERDKTYSYGICLLDCWAVSNWISKRKPEFNDI